MARYTGPREKIERRLGERLFIKGERSLSPKSAITKRPYPPGIHGRKGSRKPSEYATQLQSKQKIRNTYRLLEHQFKGYIREILNSNKDPFETILKTLELRLDNTVYRMGLAQSRDQARQLVNHGHILVDNKKVGIPSAHVKNNSVISVREGSKRMPYFSNLVPQWFQKYEGPTWLEIDKEKMTGRVKGQPTIEESGLKIGDLQALVEYYSR